MTAFRSSPPHPAHYRPDIDGLRAVAVLSVVVFHAFPNLLNGGFIGVDIFFVISGYLISTIIFKDLESGSFSFSDFYFRRINRIFPALILVLFASYVFGWFALLADEYKQLGWHIFASSGFFSNIVLWNEAGYFDNSAEVKPLLHLWSLGIEEQFYIVWPLFLWLVWKRKFNLFVVTISAIAVSFYANVKGVEDDIIAAFYSPLTRFWELFCGSLLAWVVLYKQSAFASIRIKCDVCSTFDAYRRKIDVNGTKLPNVLAILGLLFLVYGFVRINTGLHFPGNWALLPVFGAMLIISAGSGAWVNRTVLSHKLTVWFGLISFPLYLWHWPLLSFARINEGDATSVNVRLVLIAFSIALAWLTYRIIEVPLRKGKPASRKIVVLVLLMAMLGYVGYNTYERDGLGFRFPKFVQELTTYKYNYRKSYRLGTCFLDPDKSYSEFVECKTETPSNGETVLLWGDSHAAHLYPGYKLRYGKEFNILQRTASFCPPILAVEIKDRIHCKAINDYVFSSLQENLPDRVVLAANWPTYDLSKLDQTIFELKRAGVKHIDIIGPVPQWRGGLPKQLYLHYKKDMHHVISERMSFGLDENFIKIDDVLRRKLAKLDVRYISAKDILCNEHGCLTMVGKTPTAWDYGHLTVVGSEFLVAQFPEF